MSEQGQFVARVTELAQGSPYVVQPTPNGFEVAVNAADAHWQSLLGQGRLSQRYSFGVSCDDQANTFSITLHTHGVSQSAGPGGLQYSSNSSVGSGVHTKEFGRVYAWDQNANFGEVANYYFDSGEGYSLIERAAADTGWTKVMGRGQKTGLIVGLSVAGVAVVVAIVLILVLVVF